MTSAHQCQKTLVTTLSQLICPPLSVESVMLILVTVHLQNDSLYVVNQNGTEKTDALKARLFLRLVSCRRTKVHYATHLVLARIRPGWFMRMKEGRMVILKVSIWSILPLLVLL